MRYLAHKKVSSRHIHQHIRWRDPHQKQYAPPSPPSAFGGGDIIHQRGHHLSVTNAKSDMDADESLTPQTSCYSQTCDLQLRLIIGYEHFLHMYRTDRGE